MITAFENKQEQHLCSQVFQLQNRITYKRYTVNIVWTFQTDTTNEERISHHSSIRILSGGYFVRSTYFLFNSRFETHVKPLWSSLPPQYVFLIQFLCEIDANPLWRFLPRIFLIQFLFKVDAIPLWSLLPPQCIFLILFLFKIGATPLWSFLPPQLFLILFLFKWMQILSGASFHPNTYSLGNSDSKLMQILSGASFHANTYCLGN